MNIKYYFRKMGAKETVTKPKATGTKGRNVGSNKPNFTEKKKFKGPKKNYTGNLKKQKNRETKLRKQLFYAKYI